MNFRGQDAWRRHPFISGLWKEPFPGLKPAIVAFGIFLAVDYALKPAGGHGHGHGHAHKAVEWKKPDVDQMPEPKR